MKLFSIKDLERFSDIKAHSIRTWEQRFKIFTPQRTKNNIRLYSMDDVSLLLNIGLLIEHGYKISQLVPFNKEEISSYVGILKSNDAREHVCVHKLILSMFANDTEEFEMALDKSMIAWGINSTIEKVIIPFMIRVNMLSYNDTSIETHFAVTAIRRKLILGIEKLNMAARDGRSALLYLPQGEHYDLVLLYINYVLKTNGFRVFYLGTDISLANLKNAISEKKPDYLCSYAANRLFPHNQYRIFLEAHYPQLPLFIGHHLTPGQHASTHQISYIHFQTIASFINQNLPDSSW